MRLRMREPAGSGGRVGGHLAIGDGAAAVHAGVLGRLMDAVPAVLRLLGRDLDVLVVQLVPLTPQTSQV